MSMSSRKIWAFCLYLMLLTQATEGQSGSESVSDEDRFRRHLAAAKEAVDRGNLQQCREHADKADSIAQKKGMIRWNYDVGRMHHQCAANQKTLASLERSKSIAQDHLAGLSKDSDDLISLFIRIHSLFKKAGRPDSALQMLEMASEINPSGTRHGEIHHYRQKLQQNAGDSGNRGLESVGSFENKDLESTAEDKSNSNLPVERVRSQENSEAMDSKEELAELGPFLSDYRARLSELGAPSEPIQNPDATVERLRELESEVNQLPGAIGNGLADSLALSYIAGSHDEQVGALWDALDISGYLEDLVGYLESSDLFSDRSCKALRAEQTREQLEALRQESVDTVDDFSAALDTLEGDLAIAYAASALETLPLASEWEDGGASANSATRSAHSGVRRTDDSMVSDSLSVRRFRIENGPRFFDNSIPRNLEVVVDEALRRSSRPRPRGSTTEILRFDKDKLMSLGQALYQVRLLHLVLGRIGVVVESQLHLDEEWSIMSACSEEASRAVAGIRKRMPEAREVESELSKIRRYLRENRPSPPPILKSFMRWRGDLPSDLASSSGSQRLSDWLENLAITLKTRISLRRVAWAQIQRQANLEAQVGPR